ncbi:MAG: hypothetical protein L0Z50_17765 [Verrucomicrobiales bacterium]|nr:hypothetical protein [Verrucomicrobiales bacterium]
MDLSAGATFTVEWYRAADGTAQPGGILAGGKPQTVLRGAATIASCGCGGSDESSPSKHCRH